MFRLYPQCSVPLGLGQAAPGGVQYGIFDFGACTPVDILLKPIPAVSKLITSAGCCTAAGQKAIDEGIKKALSSIPDDNPYKPAITALAGAEARNCLCKGTSCGGVCGGPGQPACGTPTPKSHTALYVLGGLALVALLGGVAYSRRSR